MRATAGAPVGAFVTVFCAAGAVNAADGTTGAVLDISGSVAGAEIETLSGLDTVELGDNTLTVTRASGTFSGVVSGAGTMRLSGGDLTLSGSNTYTGRTVIVDAALRLSGSGGIVYSTNVINNGLLDLSGLRVSTSFGTISGSGTVNLGANSLTLTNASNAFAGGFAGTGALNVLYGKIELTGSSTYSGGTNVGPGATVIVSNAKALGASTGTVNLYNANLASSASFTLEQTVLTGGVSSIHTAPETALVLQGGLAGGGLVKLGGGDLVVTGPVDLEYGIQVRQGSLYANGLVESAITVQSGATLRGTGSITGPVVVRGTLAPGNSPGILQITAPVQMMAGSTYQQDINGMGLGAGPGNYSRLVIHGAGNKFVATGATLVPNLVNVTGSQHYTPYVPSIGDGFRIVTAQGGIVGEFARVVQPEGLATGTRIEVFYNPEISNSIDLFVVPTSYDQYVQARGASQNTRSMAIALDSLMQAKAAREITGAQDALLYAVSNQSEATLAHTAQALAGEVHAALTAAAPLANLWLVDSVSRELNPGAGALTPDGGRGAWVDVGANQSGWNGDSLASGFDSSRSQVAIGWNAFVRDSARHGIGFSHGKSDISAAEASGSVTNDIGFVYGQLGLGRWVVDGIAAAGRSAWETDRADPIAPLTTLRTEFEGKDTMLAAGIRLPLNRRGLALSPYARVTWSNISRDAFDEGPLSEASLSSASYSASGTRLTAGLLGGSTDQDPLNAPFTWRFNVGAGHDDPDLVQPSVELSLTGITTPVATPHVGETFAFGQVTATARLGWLLYGYFGVSGEAREGKSHDVGAHLGVRMAF
jgi:uncharacterized protein with beta-barrel porin domain